MNRAEIIGLSLIAVSFTWTIQDWPIVGLIYASIAIVCFIIGVRDDKSGNSRRNI